MKVLYVIDTLELGGAEKSFLEMLPYFKETEIVICHIYKGDYLKKVYQEKGVKVYSLNIESKYGFHVAISKVRDVIKLEKPDIIHSALLRSSLVCRFIHKVDGIPHVGSLVNDSYNARRYSTLPKSQSLKIKLFELLDKLTSGYCDSYIAISETVKTAKAKDLNLPTDKIVVIPRGRRLEDYIHLPSVIANSERPYTFINVARATASKGQKDLIKAFSLLNTKIANIKLFLIGDGPDLKQLNKLVKDHNLEGKIKALGRRSDIPELLGSADCFVFPSYSEGLGGAIIEAMLAARPVIASNIPVLAENVLPGITGLLFNLSDINDLADKMQWALLNKEEASKMGLKGREFASNKFNIVNITASYEMVYRRFVRRK